MKLTKYRTFPRWNHFPQTLLYKNFFFSLELILMAYQNASDLRYPSRNYDTIISFWTFTLLTLAVLSESLISRRNKLRFWVNLQESIRNVLWAKFHIAYLSRLRVKRLRSTPSISISNNPVICCCLSNGWIRMILSRSCLRIAVEAINNTETSWFQQTYLK